MSRVAPRIPREIIKARRKPNPRRQIEHRKFVAAIGICLGCGSEGPCEAAHIRNNTDGGVGLKPSDRFTVPLGSLANCGCHARQHRIGELSFWGQIGIDPLNVACRLWTVSGDAEQGRRAVERTRARARLSQSEEVA